MVKISEITDIEPKTAKQRKFLRYLIETMEPTEAAMRSYDCKDRLSARNVASWNLSKFGIKMSQLMDLCGLDSQKDIEDLKRLRDAKVTKHFAHEGKVISSRTYDDNDTQLRALELSMKIKRVLNDKDNGDDSLSVKVYNIIHSNDNGNGTSKATGLVDAVATEERHNGGFEVVR